MTAMSATVIRCDATGCRASLAAEPRETDLELRIRASRDRGWRFAPSLRAGGHTDLCEAHA
jgi:hypothetical protein